MPGTGASALATAAAFESGWVGANPGVGALAKPPVVALLPVMPVVVVVEEEELELIGEPLRPHRRRAEDDMAGRILDIHLRACYTCSPYPWRRWAICHTYPSCAVCGLTGGILRGGGGCPELRGTAVPPAEPPFPAELS
ncbi:hypothetical protein BDZ91DRAFT_768567 [Kalaharituber pfeilii]|nr:hypothetical protein BDZ91DRAFT_768567 [Kalaharituber pfeilii]